MATVRIQLRRGTSSQWDAANPILAAGEIGIETDTNTFKFGDGATAWNSLDYALSDTVDDYIPLSEKGQALGVATLDGNGYVPSAQLPPLAKVTVNAVADQSARLALTVEPGDIAIQADNGTTYVLQQSPASTNANWKEISATAAISAAVSAHEADTTNVHGIVDTSVLVTVDGTQTLTNKSLTSPSLTGTPTAPTASSSTNNTQVATTAYADAAVGALAVTVANDYATKVELESAVAGIDIKEAVKVATTAAITLNGTQTVDGVSLSAGDRVLVKNQADAKTNGVYVVASGAWSRATDFDETSEVKEGSFVFVVEGTSNQSHGFVLTSEGSGAGESIVFGTDSLNFTQFTGAVPVLVGNGILKSDNTLSADTTYLVTRSDYNTYTSANDIAVGTLDTRLDNLEPRVDTAENNITSAQNDITGLDNDKAPKASPTFTGVVVLPSTTSIGNVSDTEISYINGLTASAQSQIDDLNNYKAPKEDPVFTGTVTTSLSTAGFVKTDANGVLSSTAAVDQSDVTNLVSDLGLKAPLANPTFTGNVLLPSTTTIGSVSDTELSYVNGVTSAIQTQINTKSPSESPTFTGTVTLPSTTTIGDVSGTEIGYLNGVTSEVQGQIDSKAPVDGPTFTGSVTLPSTTYVGNVSGTEIGYLNGVTSEIQGQIDSKAPISGPTFTGTVVLPSTTSIGDVSATEIGYVNGVTSSIQNQIDTKASNTDLTNHNSDTTSVHGIADTAALATKTYADDAVSTHNSDTTNVHGITNTEALVTLTGAQTLTGKTLSATDNTITINASDIVDVTASAAELNILDGVTATAAELNILDGVTATAAELNILDGVTASTTELNYVDGVTSAIQTQLDAKALDADLDSHTGATTSVHGISDTAQLAYLNAASQTFTGNMEVDGNMTVDGNLTVNGTTFNASSTSIVIEDNMVQLAHQNAANTVDLGLVVAYNDGAAKHSGIVRDVSADKWKLFKGVTTEPSTTVDFTQGSLDDLEVAGLTASSLNVGSVSNTEIGYLDGVTSAIQTQIDTKAPTASPTFTGTVVLPSTTSVGNVSSTELGYLDGVTSAIQTQIDTKAPTANPTFTGTVTVAASGVAFTDGTQTKEGVPSRTTITAVSAAYNLSTGGLSLRDQMIEVGHTGASAIDVTVPTDATTNFPIGTSIDLLRTNTGGVQIIGASGVTVNATPGAYLRARWSSATLFKRAANTWVLMGDLASS